MVKSISRFVGMTHQTLSAKNLVPAAAHAEREVADVDGPEGAAVESRGR